jgi:O-antigen ligase
VLAKAGLKLKHIIVSGTIVVMLGLAIPSELLNTDYGLIEFRLHNPDYARVLLWNIAWEKFTENPILGIGPNCIYIYNEQLRHEPERNTHNFVLNNLAEVGLVGSIPFLTLITVVCVRAYRLCRDSRCDSHARPIAAGMFVGLMGTVMHGMVEPTFPGPEYSVVFWIFVALMSVLRRKVTRSAGWEIQHATGLSVPGRDFGNVTGLC